MALLLAILAAWLHLLVTSTPHYTSFVFVERLRLGLTLVFGAVYHAAVVLLKVSPVWIVIVAAGFLLIFAGIAALWRGRRWPTLIFVAVLLGANLVFIGAPGFVRGAHVGEKKEACVFNMDAQHVLRIIRYPVDRGVEFGHQQFFLASDDGGMSWSQVFQAYAREPRLTECDNLQREGESGILLRFERYNGSGNELVSYRSPDGGETWRQVSTGE